MRLVLLLAPALTAAAPRAAGAQAATRPRPAAARPAAASTAPAAAPRVFVVAPEGNEARYRVRERLLNRDLDNDAVGATREVAGRLVVDAQGRVVRGGSRITVSLAALRSDSERRDGYLRRRTLQTDSFPTVVLTPTGFRGATGGLPATGTATFDLLADLTIRGVTRPTVWQVTARAEGGAVAGTAATAFTFKEFGLDQPRVPVVLSVADTIRLEYDFRFVPGAVPK